RPNRQLFFHVAFQRARSDLSAVDISLRIGGHTFCRAGSGEFGTLARFGVRNKCEQLAVFRAADPDAAFPPIVVTRDRFGFRVCDVQNVVLINVNATRTAELLPLGDEFAVLIEDLNPVVVAVADKQTSFRVHCLRVWLSELARTGAQLATRADQLAVFRKSQNAVISGAVSL